MRIGLVLALLALTTLLLAPAAFHASTGSSGAGSLRFAGPSALVQGATATPTAGSTFNPPCYKIDTTVCISVQNQNETDIIPPTGSFISSVQPNCTTDIILVVKSHNPLDWVNAPHYGPNSPLALNVTGTLWNGDLFYSQYDGSIWHSNSPTNWWTAQPIVTQNLTYPYWYTVTLSAHASNGAPNFFPGMTVHWWMYITYNVTTTQTAYIHHLGPSFQYTCAGAWPYSPYPGSSQYAGSSAVSQDVNITVAPRSPNFNDSVHITVNTTQADALTNATIGANSYVDVAETAPNGTMIGTTTLPFPVSVVSGFGAVTTAVVIPASFSQIAGAAVTYTISIRDVANDLLVTAPVTYIVGANGSFLSGIFTDDIELATNPTSVAAEPAGFASLMPGQQLNISVTSRNPGTAISAAEVVYQVGYPLLHETVQLRVPFVRESSTQFAGHIPGLPLGAFVNFTVFTWDFEQRLEISPEFGYYTPDLANAVPEIPGNASFIYVFVYDVGSQTWVSGAEVQIQGLAGSYNSISNTTIGVTYPNQTFAPFTPLLLAANTSYNIIVNDPWFVPADGYAPNSVNATVLVLHSMSARQTLYQGPQYAVLQEGSAIVFWLNSTPPAAPISPAVSTTGAVPLAAVIGIVAAVVCSVPLLLWFRQIRARRKAEEKRVTL